jgi:hypothetical protein
MRRIESQNQMEPNHKAATTQEAADHQDGK